MRDPLSRAIAARASTRCRRSIGTSGSVEKDPVVSGSFRYALDDRRASPSPPDIPSVRLAGNSMGRQARVDGLRADHRHRRACRRGARRRVRERGSNREAMWITAEATDHGWRYKPNARRLSARSPKASDCLWTLVKDCRRLDCELRLHGESYGWSRLSIEKGPRSLDEQRIDAPSLTPPLKVNISRDR